MLADGEQYYVDFFENIILVDIINIIIIITSSPDVFRTVS